MPYKQIITTSAAQIVAQKLTTASQAAFISAVAARVKAAREAVDVDLANRVLAAEEKAQQALNKSEILDSFEKGQLEDAFVQFLTTSGLETVLAAMAFSIDGQSYTLASVIEHLVQSDKIAQEDFTFDDQGNLNSAVYTLQDGYQAIMNYVRTDMVNPETGLPSGDIQFDGQANNWRGFQVSERFIFRQLKQATTIEGQPYDYVADHQLLFRSHPQYDITGLLTPAQNTGSGVPDLNSDGVVGTGTDPGADIPVDENGNPV
ncbi:MAG: hypothetical protein KDI44_14385 [Thiothrix sp.]|nr:hypothetical protein [Thiothrix sp.]HPQ94780.1 hypothetical protein [Thiolinea sp.]